MSLHIHQTNCEIMPTKSGSLLGNQTTVAWKVEWKSTFWVSSSSSVQVTSKREIQHNAYFLLRFFSLFYGIIMCYFLSSVHISSYFSRYFQLDRSEDLASELIIVKLLLQFSKEGKIMEDFSSLMISKQLDDFMLLCGLFLNGYC